MQALLPKQMRDEPAALAGCCLLMLTSCSAMTHEAGTDRRGRAHPP